MSFRGCHEPQRGLQTAGRSSAVSSEPGQRREHPGRSQDNGTVETPEPPVVARRLPGDGGLRVRRDEHTLPRAHVLLVHAGGELRRRHPVVVGLHRRSVHRVGAVLLPDRHRPGGLGNDLRRPDPCGPHSTTVDRRSTSTGTATSSRANDRVTPNPTVRTGRAVTGCRLTARNPALTRAQRSRGTTRSGGNVSWVARTCPTRDDLWAPRRHGRRGSFATTRTTRIRRRSRSPGSTRSMPQPPRTGRSAASTSIRRTRTTPGSRTSLNTTPGSASRSACGPSPAHRPPGTTPATAGGHCSTGRARASSADQPVNAVVFDAHRVTLVRGHRLRCAAPGRATRH